ncbi:rhodanese-related sulfurtransferase [Bacillus oleivorans]|uniref:Rhodanese-related sulfurtransferase n=1 Tax=Bacillus oleivorans TaxID=1448271 RepID=A0A285D5M8_9BACI|nr:sulfurtransferase TusA family protein [Bacillus oleivorans]SNX75124.1 rhodanese-related sulfurtransferase [Bacillus oleivorans]
MNSIDANEILDVKGLACPMPIVKTKKAITNLPEGHVLEIQATDKGSTADLRAWAENSGHHYIGTIEEGHLLKHYIRKSANEELSEKKHPNVISNDDLLSKLGEDGQYTIIDVREEAEYAFNHIPNAISIPLGDLENRLEELNKEHEIYVVCRTGNRSDLAAQKLAEKGYGKVYNVVPGMSEWTGEMNNKNESN